MRTHPADLCRHLVGSAVIFGAALGVTTSPAAAASLQERIHAAQPGAVIIVAPGEHHGPLIIEKPVTLEGRNLPRINGGGKGSVISVRSDGVTIRGFVISGSGTNLTEDEAGIHITGNNVTIQGNRIEDTLHGVYLKRVAGAQVIDNQVTGKTSLAAAATPLREDKIAPDSPDLCAVPLNINARGNGIHLWNCEGAVLAGNTISETRDGIYFQFSNGNQIRDNAIRRVRYGLHYMYSDQNVFERNTFTESAAGAAIMFSKGLAVRGNRFEANRGFRAYGLLLSYVDDSRFEQNRFVGNTVGVYLENGNGNTFSANAIASNYIGIRLTSSSDLNRFSQNQFSGNLHPAELSGHSNTNRWAHDGIGNQWASATLLDLDRDGLGDLPHRELDLFGPLRRDFPAIAFLSDSPLMKLLQFANERAEIPGLGFIEDPAPLTRQYWRVRARRAAYPHSATVK